MRFQKHILTVLLLTAGDVVKASEPPADELPAPLTADAVAREALAHHPLVGAARLRLRASNAVISQVRAWPDLRAGVDIERSGTRDFFDATDYEWMVSQQIPLSGRNRREGAMATAQARVATADLRWRELDIATRARVAFVAYANAITQIEIHRRLETILHQFLDSVRVRYESGAATQADVLMAEGDLVKLFEARRDLERNLSDAQTRLNVLMNRAAQLPLPPPVPLQFREVSVDVPKLQALALEHRPELEAALRRVEAADSRITVAKRAWIPDPELRLEARTFPGGGGHVIEEYDTGIFFNFPWLNRGKYRAAISQAEDSRDAALRERDAMAMETLGQVRDQAKRIETMHHHYTLFSGRLVPLAQQTVEATRAAYASGKGSVLDVLTALRNQQDVEAMHQQHFADYLMAVAEMDAITGATSNHFAGAHRHGDAAKNPSGENHSDQP
jgi:outer membrane protein TolC